MMKQNSITQNGKIKRVLFLCIGIMVFATDCDILRKSEENPSSFDNFHNKFATVFMKAFQNEEKLQNYVDAIQKQSKAFTECKATISGHLEEQQDIYDFSSTNPTRSECIDRKIEEEIKRFLELTPKLPNKVLHQDVVPVGRETGQSGSFGVIISTVNHADIVVKKLSKIGENKTNLADVQREVAFATVFYLQNPELAPIVYGYTEDENFYYIYMEKFYMDLFDFYKKFKSGLKKKFIKLLSQATEFAEDLRKALQEIGITHNDIRNENILIQIKEDGSLKFAISDFGMATFTGLYYRTHRQILLYADGNEPHEDHDHRIIINPFQKLAYVFDVQINNGTYDDFELYATIIDHVIHNDEYALGISIYEEYMLHTMVRPLLREFQKDPKVNVQEEFLTFAKQQAIFHSSTKFKNYLLDNDTNDFGETARKRYLEFIKKGLETFKVFYGLDVLNDLPSTDDEEEMQYIEANKKVRNYIKSQVVDLWQNFEETYKKQVLTFERKQSKNVSLRILKQ